jgi:hypothetical protein
MSMAHPIIVGWLESRSSRTAVTQGSAAAGVPRPVKPPQPHPRGTRRPRQRTAAWRSRMSRAAPSRLDGCGTNSPSSRTPRSTPSSTGCATAQVTLKRAALALRLPPSRRSGSTLRGIRPGRTPCRPYTYILGSGFCGLRGLDLPSICACVGGNTQHVVLWGSLPR